MHSVPSLVARFTTTTYNACSTMVRTVPAPLTRALPAPTSHPTHGARHLPFCPRWMADTGWCAKQAEHPFVPCLYAAFRIGCSTTVGPMTLHLLGWRDDRHRASTGRRLPYFPPRVLVLYLPFYCSTIQYLVAAIDHYHNVTCRHGQALMTIAAEIARYGSVAAATRCLAPRYATAPLHHPPLPYLPTSILPPPRGGTACRALR